MVVDVCVHDGILDGGEVGHVKVGRRVVATVRSSESSSCASIKVLIDCSLCV